MFAGSRNWVTVMLYFVRMHAYLEVNGVKGKAWGKLMYDVIRYIDLCFDSGFAINAVELNLYTQLDILDCNMGLAGTVIYILQAFNAFSGFNFWGIQFGTAWECTWREYKLEIPFLHLGLDTFGLNYLEYGLTSGEKCVNPVKDPN